MRYLITGARGFIGRALTARLLGEEPDAEIVGLGRSAVPDGAQYAPPGARARYRYEQGSLLDPTRLSGIVRRARPDYVFHLAGALHTARPDELAASNVDGTAALAAVLAGSGARLVVASTGAVYGEPAVLPIPESAPCLPIGAYGLSKLAAERAALSSAAHGGFECVVARIFNVVGPGQDRQHVCGRIAAELAARVQERWSTLEVGPLDTTRDFVDVRDVAVALLLMGRKGEPGQVYNVGSGQETPIRTVVETLIRFSGAAGRIAIVELQDWPAGVQRHFADSARLEALGFAPGVTLSRSLRELLEYELANGPTRTAAIPLRGPPGAHG